MKISIISDSHDNVANLENFITWCEKEGITTLIHAGDVCAPGVVMKVIGPLFKGEVHLIFGNVGDPILLEKVCSQFANINYYGMSGEVELGGKKIMIVHEPEKTEEPIKSKKYDLVVYGHTHKSEIKEVGNTKIVNPGTVGGLFNDPTFAVYDTDNNSIEIHNL